MDREYFEQFFTLSAGSPSGLVHAKDKWGGKALNVRMASKGDVAGFYNKSTGYFHVKCANKSYLAHRIVALLVGMRVDARDEVDHKDGNKKNNAIANLRTVQRTLNMRNRGRRTDNKTGQTGVNRLECEGRVYYIARWRDKGKQISRCFRVAGDETEALDLAVEARKEAVEEMNRRGAGYTDRHGKY